MTTARLNSRRPSNLPPHVKRFISQSAINNRTMARDVLVEQLTNEITGMGEVAPSEETLKHYISDARGKHTIDKPWNTATLNDIPVRPEVIPALTAIQRIYKAYHSKPLTIREAKWFDRLFDMTRCLGGGGLSQAEKEEMKTGFLYLVSATWAQVYAYREQIDAIAGIKNPDYSDLDDCLVQLDIRKAYRYGNSFVLSQMGSMGRKQDLTVEYLKAFSNKIIKPSMYDQARVIETQFLNHSLGSPDVPNVYFRILDILYSNPGFYSVMKTKLYHARLEFFKALRQISVEQPKVLGSLDDAEIENILFRHIDYLKDEELETP